MKRIFLISLIMVVSVFYLGSQPFVFANNVDISINLSKTIEDIVKWKKLDTNTSEENFLFNQNYLTEAGTTNGDWYPIGIGRGGYKDDYSAYLAVVSDKIAEKYKTDEKLSSTKATEWHRVALAITALGGNPTKIGEHDGSAINLISDGTFKRGLTASVGKQGINGWIWGLIAMDSKRYIAPQDAFNTRKDFIIEILRQQLSDGGFALAENIADTDMTAMALQALSPYYNSEIVYTFTSLKQKDKNNNYSKFNKSVKQVVDEALVILSKQQYDDGDFANSGIENAESTCQVLVALTSLNINPLTDDRFIKNGNTVFDGIMKYRVDNGGFTHSYINDTSNPTSIPKHANTMASEQALYSLVALDRFNTFKRSLYDMRDEFTSEIRKKIDDTIALIGNLKDTSSSFMVENALTAYNTIDELDRGYVSNYWKLSALAKKYQLNLPDETLILLGNCDNGNDSLLHFSQANKIEADSLPEVDSLTTEYYVNIVNLRYILYKSADFEGKSLYKIKLDNAYNQILSIQTEIDNINNKIATTLYPLEKIGLNNKAEIYLILTRYNNLSAFDKLKITHFNDLTVAKTRVDNISNAIAITASMVVVAVAILVFVTLDIKRRKRKKLEKYFPESEE